MGSGFEGFDFSHEGVKRVVGLFTGFVSVIASAPYCFLYLNQRIHDVKKKKKKKALKLLVLLSQDLPSPFVLVRFARIFLPKRYSVQSRA